MLRKLALLLAVSIHPAICDTDVQNDFTRIKRAPYHCDYPQQFEPPPPPPPQPPVPHPRAFMYPIPSNKDLRWEQFIKRQMYNERNLEHQEYYDSREPNGYQNQFDNYNGDGNRPCAKCAKKNLAVSNAKSDTGDAVAVAISNGNNG
ncbi:uncharacterized protein [Battus philenor]|uniref:uncharacterized protein n=1 Tax=Battus philenor TaxID=42288 RepID=UPI0035CEEA59